MRPTREEAEEAEGVEPAALVRVREGEGAEAPGGKYGEGWDVVFREGIRYLDKIKTMKIPICSLTRWRRRGAVFHGNTLIVPDLDHDVKQLDEILVDLGVDDGVRDVVDVAQGAKHSPPKNNGHIYKNGIV